MTTSVMQPEAARPELHDARPADPCVLVIFGITGDLTKRLLFPALYNLAHNKLLPEQFAVAGFALGEISEEQLRQNLGTSLREAIGDETDEEIARWLLGRVRFIASDFESAEGWQLLRDLLQEMDRTYNTQGNYLFYLAVAPNFFLTVMQRLSGEDFLKQDKEHWRRAIIEKPFGHDLESARKLNRDLVNVVRESQIYRIDHYLGKETVQNILIFRFANGIFEPIWNRRYIDHVQITVAETLGVEQRGRYYDGTGALRDMIPNHLIQLLALTAMEPPSSFSASSLQNEQVKVLESVPPINPEECAACVVRAQYAHSGDLAGYTEEPLVNPESKTETFVAVRVSVDNWRWAGVPFYLRTGKRLRRRNTEIVIQFRNPPMTLFRRSGASLPGANRLVLGIQPQESIALEFEGKIPGPVLESRPVQMDFNYKDYFGKENRTGYETLLYDAMIGDASLFKRADMIEAGWSIIQPILNAWANGHGGPVYEYPSGSEGPSAADDMIARERRNWRSI